MLRKFKLDDTNKIMDIWLKTSFDAHNFIDKQYWYDNYDIVKNEYIPVADTLVYDIDNTPVGFISVIDSSIIGALFLLPEFQGNSYGREMIQAMIKKYGHLQLTVYCENVRTIGFYKKMGFKIIECNNSDCIGHKEYLMEN